MISRRVPGLLVRHVITQMEDAMRPQAQHPGLQGWQRLAGRWATEATHPALPGTVVTGQATFEWLEDPPYRPHCQVTHDTQPQPHRYQRPSKIGRVSASENAHSPDVRLAYSTT
jgi:hypothetical protein